MQIGLGEKIRELRRRANRTQEMLAAAVGVTGQAVSRWEANGGYPDMEIIPAIAHYFNVTIDELFGYDSDRTRKICAYTDQYDEMEKTRDDTAGMLSLMREATAEFPSSDVILIRLANALYYHGSVVYGLRTYTSEDCDYPINDGEYGAKNEYFQESLKILEQLLVSAADPKIRGRAGEGNCGKSARIMSCPRTAARRGNRQ